ncbi:mitochondrial succinate dehydrogenase subunit C [Polychaeton citri CBS 116435]|uniref:Mitochondrial succinate dehydrogenase subunit C n=1 Tax=Polychaeton citri CBS 116435 TaxID=1314669 RepID=A0A9P4UTU8_9PEZI|nr:mitochondrial succinate dehydrogenase subunit C [Polychaeton citri CBS 116435]
MLAQRFAQTSLRRLAVQQARFAAPSAIATGRVFTTSQYRPVAATIVDEKQAQDQVLAQQRLKRPVSPHLSIYRPQVTWYLSGLNRITGCILSGTFYIFGAAYLIAPVVGWHLETASIAAAVAAWPLAVKFLAKSFFALPFTFHTFNGIRHLTWDTATMIRNKQVNITGWAVVGLSVVSALGLALI